MPTAPEFLADAYNRQLNLLGERFRPRCVSVSSGLFLDYRRELFRGLEIGPDANNMRISFRGLEILVGGMSNDYVVYGWGDIGRNPHIRPSEPEEEVVDVDFSD